ncbi:MAG: hypothetical protein WCJ35_25515, partial [Planctomycetota bacterium]
MSPTPNRPRLLPGFVRRIFDSRRKRYNRLHSASRKNVGFESLESRSLLSIAPLFGVTAAPAQYFIEGKILYDTTNPKPVRDAEVRVSAVNGLAAAPTFTKDDGSYFVVLPQPPSAYNGQFLAVTTQTQPSGTGAGQVLRAVEVKVDGSWGILNGKLGKIDVRLPDFGGDPGYDVTDIVIGGSEPTDANQKAFWTFDAAVSASRLQATLPGVNPGKVVLTITTAALQGSAVTWPGTANIWISPDQAQYWDTVCHEYGHSVAYAAGFYAPNPPMAFVHDLRANTRTINLTNPTLGNILSSDTQRLQLAFQEGWADFYSILVQNVEYVPTTVPYAGPKSLVFGDNANFPGYNAKTIKANTLGYGEDNEISVMRILSDLADGKGAVQNLPWIALNFSITDNMCLGFMGLYNLIRSKQGNLGPVTTLSGLYNKLLATDAKETLAINDLFVMNGVSPPLVTPVTGNAPQDGVAVWHTMDPLTFQFNIPQGSPAMGTGAGQRNLLNMFRVVVLDSNGTIVVDSGVPGVPPVNGAPRMYPVNQGNFTYVGQSQTTVSWLPTPAQLAKLSSGAAGTTYFCYVNGSWTFVGGSTGDYQSLPCRLCVAPALAGNGNPDWPSEPPVLAQAVEGTPETGVIASFTDAGWAGTPNDYSASIAWGNGSVTTVTGTQSAYGQIVYHDPNDPTAGFDVIGSQTYADDGLFAVRTTIKEDGTSIGIIDSRVTVDDAALSVSVLSNLQFIERVNEDKLVATFSDAGRGVVATDFAAMIDWDDGTTTAGKITYDEITDLFYVRSDYMHAYDDFDNHSIIVTVYDRGGASDQKTKIVTVASCSGISPTTSTTVLTPMYFGLSIGVNEDNSQVLATFTDKYTGEDTGSTSTDDFLAVITWESPNDVPHRSAGTITYTANPTPHFIVTSEYTYDTVGQEYPTIDLYKNNGN